MKEITFTFKEHKPTGKWRSFDSSYWEIKLNKKVVGHIYEQDFGATYSITFSIKHENTDNPNCHFKNIKLKATFKTIDETKEFLKRKTKAITEKYDLYALDD